jgi:type VI secretion system protein
MPLTLVLESGPGAGRETRTLSQGTLSIGRAPGNDWVLADPDRQLSKTHCVIVAAGGRCMLTDLSTNGVFVNGSPERMPRDSQIQLTDGDDFRIGEYVFRVNESARAADPYAAGHAPLVPGGAPRADPFAGADDLTPDPLDDVFGTPAAAPFAHPIAAPPAPVMRSNDPFDIADERVPTPRIDPEDSLFRGLTPAENWQGPSQPDHVDAPMQAFAAPKVVSSNLDDLDIDALLGDTPPGQAPAPSVSAPPAAPAGFTAPPAAAPRAFGGARIAPPAPAHRAPVAQPSPFDSEPELPPRPAPAPGRAAAPSAPTAPPAPAAPSADGARLLAAFLDGAGVPGLALGPDPERAMHEAGAVFRAMVDGIRQVLISRASIKNELRVEQTMLRARDNNALKFSVTTEDAVGALLQPSRPGYKPPLDATTEAFDDVRSHEMAVMAGVQTALMGLLKRFEPGALEKRLEPGMLGNFLPAARKARTWELFCATYNAIAAEAQEDFQSVFGREFARAYDAQMRKL